MAARQPALPDGLRFLSLAGPAGAVPLPARHGARAGRGQPAVEPGARAHLRGRVGRVQRRAGDVRPARLAAAGAPAAPLPRWRRCAPRGAPHVDGGWVGADARARPSAARRRRRGGAARRCTRRVGAIVVGAGVAGLGRGACVARGGRRRRATSSSSRTRPAATAAATRIGGMRCPLGAHYLPVPGERARRGDRAARRARPAPHRCSAAPSTTSATCATPAGAPVRRRALARRPAAAVEPARRAAATRWRSSAASRPAVAGCRPRVRSACPPAAPLDAPALDALDAQTFGAWLDARGYDRRRRCAGTSTTAAATTTAPAAAQVSAWAGVHYFASRHGFHAPGDDDAREHDAVLTWPARQCLAHASGWPTPLRERLHTGAVVLRIAPGRHDVAIDVWNGRDATRRALDRRARSCSPCRCSSRARLLDPRRPRRWAGRGAAALRALAGRQPAPAEPLLPTAAVPPPAGTTCSTAAPALGYVDAMHQSLRPLPGRPC